jgi:hypothetical protein
VDAEKFDKVVLDLLYDELDELTRASAIRHTEQSGRAKALYAELRATREVGALPLVDPPDELEERILQAAERARAERPLRQRLGAFVSIAASYAMRPQLGMAAVLLLMVGSSLLLLRVKPGAPSSVQVTERGVPESDKEAVTVVPVAPSPPAANARESDQPAEPPRQARARAEGPKGDLAASHGAGAPAEKEPAPVAEAAPTAPAAGGVATLDGVGSGSADDIGATAPGSEAFAAAPAKPAEEGSSSAGCETDLPHYEAIMAVPSATSAAALDAARFAAAQCYQRLGRVDAARRTYRVLLTNPTYADASRRALNVLPESNSRVAEAAPAASANRSAAKAAAPTATAAKPSKP